MRHEPEGKLCDGEHSCAVIVVAWRKVAKQNVETAGSQATQGFEALE
jgi:hypothetical protein